MESRATQIPLCETTASRRPPAAMAHVGDPCDMEASGKQSQSPPRSRTLLTLSVDEACGEAHVQVQPRKQKTFFDLPRELRDEIYHLCSAHPSPQDAGGNKQLCHSILAVCRAMRREAAPIFWAGHVAKHKHFWNFAYFHVKDIRAFCNALRPYSTAMQMRWSARILYPRRRRRLSDNQSVTWKALLAVLHQRKDGNKVLDQLMRDCQEHFDTYMEHGAVTFWASGEVCGIVWVCTRNEFTREESVRLQGPLAQLDWKIIATGEGDH